MIPLKTYFSFNILIFRTLRPLRSSSTVHHFAYASISTRSKRQVAKFGNDTTFLQKKKFHNGITHFTYKTSKLGYATREVRDVV